MLGEIATGTMQEAVEAELGEITFSHLFPKAKNVFALRMKGMCMKELDISDGDYVLLSKTEMRNGDAGQYCTTVRRHLRRFIKKNFEFDLNLPIPSLTISLSSRTKPKRCGFSANM